MQKGIYGGVCVEPLASHLGATMIPFLRIFLSILKALFYEREEIHISHLPGHKGSYKRSS